MKVRTVLNIEDSDDDVMLLRSACKSARVAFRFLAVADGEKAIAYLEGEGPYANREQFPMPDLILLDLKMPRKSGLEVLAWIRAQPHLRKMPVLVYTASLHAGEMDRARQLGADEFLIKTGALDYLKELAKAIDLVFAQEPPSLHPINAFTAREPVYQVLPPGPWLQGSVPRLHAGGFL